MAPGLLVSPGADRWRTFRGPMSQMLKSSGAMAAATLTSRLLGMVREMVYASFMGAGWVAAAFQVAFAIPNLFRRLLGEGALTAAFIPIFKEKERQAAPAEMWRAANAVLSGLVIAATVLIGLGLLVVSGLLAVLPLSEQTELMLRLLRVMFPYLLLVCVAAVFMGMLNARGHFFIPALGATTLNVVMIAAVLLAPRVAAGEPLSLQVFVLAVGVLAAGVAQAVFQLPTLHREGFRLAWVNPLRDPTVREVVQRMIPGTIGIAAFQINVLVVQNLGLVLGGVGDPIIAPFNYAVRLMELPQGVFGISLATYLLPTLSGFAADKQWDRFRGALRQGIGHLLLVNSLCAVLLVVLATPIIRLLFERGRFDPADTANTAFALQCLAFSLVGYSLVNILARAFFALKDTRTPMQISLVCLGLNLMFAVGLIFPLREGGLGLANTISSTTNCLLLLFALRKKLKTLALATLRPGLLPVLAATALAGALAWFAQCAWGRHLGHETLWLKLGEVFVPAGLAVLAYAIIVLAARVPAAVEIKEALQERLRR
jgi:putative peptidoglycan lipid II flippase